MAPPVTQAQLQQLSDVLGYGRAVLRPGPSLALAIKLFHFYTNLNLDFPFPPERSLGFGGNLL